MGAVGITETNETVDIGETAIDITPALTALNRPSLVMLDDELMEVTAGTSTLTVTKGAYGTADAAHNSSAQIFKVERVQSRGDSLLVYYYDDTGLVARKIVILGDQQNIGNIPSTSGKPENSLMKVDDQEDAVWATPTLNPFDTAANIANALNVAATDGTTYTKEITVTETAGAGVFTQTVDVPAGTRLLDIEWATTATFDADTAALSVGRNTALTDFINAANVKASGSGALATGLNAGKEGYKFVGNDTITVALTLTGTGGTTGRHRVLLVLARPFTALAAVKA